MLGFLLIYGLSVQFLLHDPNAILSVLKPKTCSPCEILKNPKSQKNSNNQ